MKNIFHEFNVITSFDIVKKKKQKKKNTFSVGENITSRKLKFNFQVFNHDKNSLKSTFFY